ncbi:hypothetical protein [Pedobacter sp. BS3]|uniref:hypothetical protein n=1 Tax=Pedobacter sp. BS3 TaxID=2567937 RepID=UPI0016599DEA|nr:hypothetical protein [Pedobacter sp. BS3]
MTDLEILVDFLRKIELEIKANMIANNQVATRKTIDSFEVITPNDVSAELWAAKWVMALEDGRKPTSHTGPFQSAGKTLVESIKEWIAAKKLDLNPYAVARKIHAEGTKLYRQGGKSGVISTVITEQRLSNLVEIFADQYLSSLESNLLTV